MIRKIDSNIFSLTILKVTTFSRIRQTKNDTTRHEKALLIDFIRYQRKEIKHFIRCYRIKNTVFILRYRIKFVLLPQKVSIWKRNCFER